MKRADGQAQERRGKVGLGGGVGWVGGGQGV